jgi:DNA-binding transcriptional LysR family regulator
MNGVELWELRYFIAVAEDLHFGRAAARIGMAQPPLSRAISKLERRLGVRLFDRTTRSVTLTAAGQTLLDEAREIIAAVDRAVARTRATVTTTIRVAAIPGVGVDLLRRVLDVVAADPRRQPPELIFTQTPLAAMRAGEADLAIGCDTEGLDGLDGIVLDTEEPVFLVPAHSPLAARLSLARSELAATPSFQYPAPDMPLDELLALVALDRLITVVGDSTSVRLTVDVAAVPAEGFPPMRVVLAWTQTVMGEIAAAAQGSAAALPGGVHASRS